MTSLEQRIMVLAKATCSSVSTWNPCCQWLLLSQLWLPACACYWCRFRRCPFSPPLSQVWLSAPFAVVYGIVLGCRAYCAFADPGQVKKTRNMKIAAVKHEAIKGAEHRVSKVVPLNSLVRSGCLLLHEPKPLSQIRASECQFILSFWVWPGAVLYFFVTKSGSARDRNS